MCIIHFRTCWYSIVLSKVPHIHPSPLPHPKSLLNPPCTFVHFTSRLFKSITWSIQLWKKLDAYQGDSASSAYFIFFLDHSNSSDPQQPTYGITSPITLAGPKPEDHQLSEQLVEALKPHGVFENEEELNHRWGLLIFLLKCI